MAVLSLSFWVNKLTRKRLVFILIIGRPALAGMDHRHFINKPNVSERGGPIISQVSIIIVQCIW